jgi:hypothetical protein
VEASSGEVVRHRLSLAGNRKLNYALHKVAVCQARSDARGGAYYRKRMAEGKSQKPCRLYISGLRNRDGVSGFAGAVARRVSGHAGFIPYSSEFGTMVDESCPSAPSAFVV